MPYIDITQAKRELLAEKEPITLRFGQREWVFPGAMPAEFEIEQMALARETRELPPDTTVEGAELRLMKAAYGEQYNELEKAAPPSELMMGFAALVQMWMEAFQDPNLPRRLMELTAPKSGGAAKSSAPSSTTSLSLKPTSSASTASTSPRRSSANGSRGGASPPSTAASAQSR